MRPPPFFRGVAPAVAWLRLILIGSAFLGLLASAPLWQTNRAYPLLPVASWFPALPPPVDQVVFALTLLSLLSAIRFYRPCVMFFLATTFILYLGDQNRGTPWLYMYWIMMLLTLFPDPIALAGCRFALSAIYFWGGLQKLNPRFFALVPEWFVAPAYHWGLGFLFPVLKASIAAAPAVEMFIGLGLWMPRLRWVAMAAASMVHVFALIFLGPLGHNYNWVVWPWNLGMLALVLALFPANSLRDALAHLRRSRSGVAVVALFCLLPALSFRGWWDSYFSFALYSGNLATADIFVT